MAVIPVSAIGGTAVRVTATATPLSTGLLVIADPANTKPVFVGNGSGVTAGTDVASGHPVLPGGAIFLSKDFLLTSGTGQADASNAYAIAASGSNTLYCVPDGNKEDYEAGAAVGAAAAAVDLTKIGGTAFALGQALAAASVPVVLTAAQLASLTAPVLAAGTALIGKVVAHGETSTIYDGTTALVPKFAIIDHATSGDNTIVAAVTSKKIRVLNVVLVASAAVNVRFESGAGGTALTGVINLAANGGFAPGYCPAGHFETAAGALLNLELSGAVSVDGWIVYVEV